MSSKSRLTLRIPRLVSFGFLVLLNVVALTHGCKFDAHGSGGTGAGDHTGGGAGGSAPTIPDLTSLTITPDNQTITATQGGNQGTQQYTVKGMVGNDNQDLTKKVTYTVSPSGIVTIDSNGLATATGKSGGVVTISAHSGHITASVKLTVMYTFSGGDPKMTDVPSDAGSKFGGANDDTRAPQIVYPNDGVLFPPNISGVEIHFTPGMNNTLFEVGVSGPLATITTYIRCPMVAGIDGCIYTPDPTIWSGIARSNAGQGPATLTIRGTDDNGSSVGTSGSIQIQFSKDDVRGGLYYWTTSNMGSTTNSSGSIMRWDFSGTQQTATLYLPAMNSNDKTCYGCHAVSPDGKRLVASAGGQGDGRLLLWDITMNAAAQPFPLAQRSQFESWNRSSDQFVGVYGDNQGSGQNAARAGATNLMIFDGMTGARTSTIDLGGRRADHPDWSKNMDGPETIVFTSASTTASTTDQRMAMGGIAYVQRTGGGAWGAPADLVPAELGKNRYYPAISPDGALVVYDESTCATMPASASSTPDKTCNADTDLSARVFLTRLPPGDPTPVDLGRANKPGVADAGMTTLTNSFPRWAPFVYNLDEQHKQLWFTFSSTRMYGLRKPPAPANMVEATSGTLIWMVGVDLNGAATGNDPTFAAFCLPFQNIATSNHIAQWTQVFINSNIDPTGGNPVGGASGTSTP